MNATQLIASNIKAHTVDGYTAAHMVAAAHARTIATLCAQLNAMRAPRPGTKADAANVHKLICDAINAAAALAETHAGANEVADALTDALLVFEDDVREHESESQPEEQRNGLLSFGVAAHNAAMGRL
jgi:hypothetical protein